MENEKEKQYEIPMAFEWSVLLVGLFILIGAIFYTMRTNDTLDNELVGLQSELTNLRSEVLDREQAEAQLRGRVIYESTGIDPERVSVDTSIFEQFIQPAFEWDSGEAYDTMRSEYIEQLGSDSSFVQTYVAENLTVDQYNYVDLNNLKSKYLSSQIYPLEERDGAMDFLGVISYYLYNDESDLVGINRLSSSKAVVRFTVSGPDDLREVSVIEAVPGFSSE